MVAFDRGIGLEPADEERRRPAAARQVLADLFEDLLALIATNAAEHRVAAADLRPARHQGADDPGAARVVRILIRVDLHAARARGFDALDERHRQAVARRAERFHVTDDADQARFLGDRDDFLHRRDQADRVVALVTDMAAVDAAELRGHSREGDDLAGFRIGTRGIVQAARQSERACAHALPDQVHHLGDLLGVGVAIRHAHHRLAHRAVRNHQPDVEPDPLLAVARALVAEVRRTATVRIDEDRGDALGEHRLTVLEGLGGEARPGVRMHVDEARGDDKPGRVDRLRARWLRQDSRRPGCDRR